MQVDGKNIYGDDEISLIDLIFILIKRKKLLITLTLVSMLIAIIIALTQNSENDIDLFKYRSALDIGRYVLDSENFAVIDSPANLIAKIDSIYAPAVLEKDSTGISFLATTPDNSNIVVIESTGPVTAKKTLLDQHNKLISLVTRSQKQFAGKLAVKVVYQTQAIAEPIGSMIKSTRPKTGVIVLIGIMLGLFLGIFAAFTAEFSEKFREEIARRAC